MRVAVGGTFNTIHKGHELLFETAFAVGDFVEVGLTSDDFARSIKSVDVLPYPLRKSNLERYLERFGKPFSVTMISDKYGPAASSSEIGAIVVSPETRPIADEINMIRLQKGLPPLKVHVIRNVKADDSRPISSSRILSGEIDKDGHLLRPLKVAVGSTNEVKVEAVRSVFAQAFGLVEVASVKPDDTFERQPMEERVVEGAVRRAKLALERTGADFGVGVEAGLFYNKSLDRFLDVQYCAIVDASGRLTVGHGPGFEYPPSVVESVLKGGTVGDTMSVITDIEDIGRKQGSIGYLSDGMIDRRRLTEIAVLMALIPRIRRELYPE